MRNASKNDVLPPLEFTPPERAESVLVRSTGDSEWRELRYGYEMMDDQGRYANAALEQLDAKARLLAPRLTDEVVV